MRAIEALHEKLAEHEKQVLETEEDAHTDKLLNLRMSNLHPFITGHYPDNRHRREMLAMCHKMKELSLKCLEHKE